MSFHASWLFSAKARWAQSKLFPELLSGLPSPQNTSSTSCKTRLTEDAIFLVFAVLNCGRLILQYENDHGNNLNEYMVEQINLV